MALETGVEPFTFQMESFMVRSSYLTSGYAF